MNENNETTPEPGPEPEDTRQPDSESDSEPTSPPQPDPQSGYGPRTEPLITRLRRSKDDQVVGGVAGGLGAATGIDPLIFRVAFVAAAFLGGAGLVLYIAAWALIPEEGSDIGGFGKEFNVKNDAQVRTIGLIAAGIFAILAALGSGPWFFTSWASGSFWAVISIAIVVGLIYWIITASKGQGTSSQPFTSSGDPSMSDYSQSSWTPPNPTAPVHTAPAQKAPKPPAEPGGLMLFGLTLSIGAIVIGAVAMWALMTEPLEPKVYLAAALGVTAIGTLIGARWGKPGPLLTTGTILSVILIASSVIPSVSVGSVDMSPASVRELREPITLGMGEIRVDLRDIDPETSLQGRTVNISNGMGRIEVVVPKGVDVEVNAAVRIGQLSVLGRGEATGSTSLGIGQRNTIRHEADGPNPLIINASTNIGEVLVTER